MSLERDIKQQIKKYSNVQNLMKYFTVDKLKEVHNSMNGNKASGIDNMTKYKYNTNLNSNLQNLVTRIRKGTYYPQPVNRVEILKSNGKIRPLGIPCYEDKLVQAIISEILNAIYEPIFLECSNGYRPNRSCHTALSQLKNAIYNNNIKYIVEADIEGFFNNIDHQKLLELLKIKIIDKHFIKYIKRFLESGIMINGEFHKTEIGTSQGRSYISNFSKCISSLCIRYMV